MLFCTTAIADTIDINWYVDDTVYDTSTCTVGGDVILPPAPTKRGYTFQGWRDFKPIKYLESTGTQLIEFNYYANPNTKIYVDFALTTTSQNNKFIVFGGWNPLCFGIHYASVFQVCSYNDGTANNLTNSNATTLSRNVVILDATNHVEEWGNVQINSQTITGKNVASLSTTNTSTSKFSLFGVPTTPSKNALARIYRFKLWDNGDLIYDIIPVLDHNSVPCMYDLVSNQFFYNAGTGDFIAGPVINQ